MSVIYVSIDAKPPARHNGQESRHGAKRTNTSAVQKCEDHTAVPGNCPRTHRASEGSAAFISLEVVRPGESNRAGDGQTQTRSRKASDEDTIKLHDRVFSPGQSRSSSWETWLDVAVHRETGSENYASHHRARSVSVNSTGTIVRYGEDNSLKVDVHCCESTDATPESPRSVENDCISPSSQNGTHGRVSSMEELTQSHLLESCREGTGSTTYEFDLVGEIDVRNCHEAVLDADVYRSQAIIQKIHADMADGVISRVQAGKEDERGEGEDSCDTVSADCDLEVAIRKSVSAYLESPEANLPHQVELMNNEDEFDLEEEQYHHHLKSTMDSYITDEDHSRSEYSSQEELQTPGTLGDMVGSVFQVGDCGSPHQGHCYQTDLSPIPEFPTPSPSPARPRRQGPTRAPQRFSLNEETFHEWTVDTNDLHLVPSSLKSPLLRPPLIPPRGSSRTLTTPDRSSDLSGLLHQFHASPSPDQPSTPEQERSYFDFEDSPCSGGRFFAASSGARNLIRGLKTLFQQGTETMRRPAAAPTLRRTVRRFFSKREPDDAGTNTSPAPNEAVAHIRSAADTDYTDHGTHYPVLTTTCSTGASEGSQLASCPGLALGQSQVFRVFESPPPTLNLENVANRCRDSWTSPVHCVDHPPGTTSRVFEEKAPAGWF
ncbi:hypothetical protein D7B24_000714 [Verticillium nonalfalfae]|uniref:Uncharacterized protein n=1 Tax=Verticillium nonalfalfae TaxID=1051616 RepID=A0A3M9YHF5_9PEZI|nr:uncharacterized protein D7B24_000714 [Verticillium nonalfalfae]RNJ59997.1 hypothetical protein D7B24_000714 [Verticillium nonalfalfae]